MWKYAVIVSDGLITLFLSIACVVTLLYQEPVNQAFFFMLSGIAVTVGLLQCDICTMITRQENLFTWEYVISVVSHCVS